MHQHSAIEIRDLFLSGSVSAVEVVKHFLERIEKYNPSIGAFVCTFSEKAIQKAEQLDAKRKKNEKLGSLAAVPVALKDNIHIKGELTTCASKFLTNYRAPFAATATKLLEAEDAIFIGKTNMDEFAMGSSTENSALQKTFNPWNLKCTPGGSSGGSAAAVAARLCPLAFGSDTGGSIRQPASLCGVVGFKPTYGRVSRHGLVAFGSSLDQIGPLATDTADVSLAMQIIGQPCENDSTSIATPPENYLENLRKGIKGFKIGIPREFLEALEQEPKKIFHDSLGILKDLGAEIVDIDLNILKYSIAVYYILATAEASTNLARFDGIRYGRRSADAITLDDVYELSKEEGFGEEVKRRILLGTYVLSAGYQDAYYKKAQKVRTLMIQKHAEAFQKCQIIAMPVCPSAAFEIGSIKDPIQMYLEDIYTIGSNLVGTPAISVPSGFSSDGKPIGIQFIGAQKQDSLVLQTSYSFEQATAFGKKIPENFL